MKNVYKWQLGGNMYLYITDAFNPLIASTQPFIYNSVTEEKTFYDGHTATEEADDAGIADTVSGLTYEVYATRFEEAKILLQNEGYIYAHLGTPEMYYNVEECSLPKSGYIPAFTASGSVTGTTESNEVSGSVCVTRDTGEKSIHFSFKIPNGPQGYTGEQPKLVAELDGDFGQGTAVYEDGRLYFDGLEESQQGLKGARGLQGKRGPIGLTNTGFTFQSIERGVFPDTNVASGWTDSEHSGAIFYIPKGPQGNKGRTSTNMWKGSQQDYDALYANGELENVFYATLNGGGERVALYAKEYLLIPNNYYLMRYGGSGFTTNAGPIYVGDEQVEISSADILKSGNWSVNSGQSGRVGLVSVGDSIQITPFTSAISGETQTVVIKDASGLKKQTSNIVLRKVSVSVFIRNKSGIYQPYVNNTIYDSDINEKPAFKIVYTGYTEGDSTFLIKKKERSVGNSVWGSAPIIPDSGLSQSGEYNFTCYSELNYSQPDTLKDGQYINTITFYVYAGNNGLLLKSFSVAFKQTWNT